MSGGCPSRPQSVWEQRGGLLAPCGARPPPGWCGLSARRKPQRRGRVCPRRCVCLGNTGQGVGSGHPPRLEGGVLVVADPVLGPPGRPGGWGTQGVQASSAGPCPGPQPFTPRLSSVLSTVRPPSSRCGRRSRAEPGGGSRLASRPPHTHCSWVTICRSAPSLQGQNFPKTHLEAKKAPDSQTPTKTLYGE